MLTAGWDVMFSQFGLAAERGCELAVPIACVG